jgi:hypothetical protein
MRTSSTKNSLIIGISIVLGASLLSMGISNASGTTIKACAKKSGGAMRLIDSNKNCKKSERTLTWGTQGETGATGATGSKGVSYAAYKLIPSGSLLVDAVPYTMASLDGLTAGNYLLNATVEIANDNLDGFVECRLFIPVGTNTFYASPSVTATFVYTPDIPVQLTANYVVADLPGGTYGEVSFECQVSGISGGRVDAGEVFISAIKVDTLVRQ